MSDTTAQWTRRDFYARGVALHQANRLSEALAAYDRALALAADHAEALCHRGTLLWAMGRHDEALASTARAITCRPTYIDALYNLGVMLQQARRLPEAIESFRAALALKPDFAPALNNLSSALLETDRPHEALAACERALAAAPRAGLYHNRGLVLAELGRGEEAMAAHEQALALDGEHPDAFGALAAAALRLCDWPRTAILASEVKCHVMLHKSLIAPLILLGYSDDPALQLQGAQQFTNAVAGGITAQPPRPAARDRIRVTYVSADFRDHAVAYLIAGLIERHDRTRFEIIGVSLGKADDGETRRRLVAAFDQFHDVAGRSDAEAAALLRSLGVDIAVDLTGHTHGARPGLFARRAAPVQVNYLGYPGTLGADFIDYILADAIVAPFADQPFFSEQIVHLPSCYQANDALTMLDPAPTRAEAGLPETGFVFCCFNSLWKITQPVFDIWMRLLRTVPSSVLWLIADQSGAMARFKAAASARGVDPARLVFAERLPRAAHLARHQRADLFLDTLPYNAHTGASDALRAGVPVITRVGASFSGRVAASLLTAIGLPELVTNTADEYEARALELARVPASLISLREKLAHNRRTHSLFDVARFARNIETAYAAMHEIALAGQAPRGFAFQ